MIRARLRAMSRSRSKRRGMTTIPMLIEAAMVMGWFVALIVGEKGVSKATSSRRSAEDGAEQSATASSAQYCQPQSSTVTQAMVSPSMFTTPKPDVQAAISAIAGLGLGGQKTFPYYMLPMQNIRVTGSETTDIRISVDRRQTEEHRFVGKRSLGCLERPLDTPQGSLEEFRNKIWLTKFMGY